MDKKEKDKLLDFVKGSNHFCGFTMYGHFDMPREYFNIAYEHYLKTGENVLDEYSDIIYLSWDIKDFIFGNGYPLIEERKILYYKKLIQNKGFWIINNLLLKEQIEEIKRYLLACEKYYLNKKTYKSRRKEASIFTNNIAIRKKVFKRDGKKCSKCGSSENLTIDHITPIYRGGGNELGNLQVLCKSCNSSKSTKIKDYRNK